MKQKKKSVQDENRVPASFSQGYKKPANEDTGSSLNTSTHGGTSILDLNATNSTSFVHKSRSLPTVNASFLPSTNILEDMSGSLLPPPLIPLTHTAAQVLPMNHIQINQQQTQCIYTQPYCSVSVPSANYLPQKQANHPQPQANPFL